MRCGRVWGIRLTLMACIRSNRRSYKQFSQVGHISLGRLPTSVFKKPAQARAICHITSLHCLLNETTPKRLSIAMLVPCFPCLMSQPPVSHTKTVEDGMLLLTLKVLRLIQLALTQSCVKKDKHLQLQINSMSYYRNLNHGISLWHKGFQEYETYNKSDLSYLYAYSTGTQYTLWVPPFLMSSCRLCKNWASGTS